MENLENQVKKIIQDKSYVSQLNYQIQIIDKQPTNAYQFPNQDFTFKEINVIFTDIKFQYSLGFNNNVIAICNEISELDSTHLVKFILERCFIKFWNENINLDSHIEFKKCKINLNIHDIELNEIYLTNKNFQNCEFENLSISSNIETLQIDLSGSNIKLLQFSGVNIPNTTIPNNKESFIFFKCDINDFNIINSTFNAKFYINKQYDGNRNTSNITKLQIKNSVFKENFKLHKCVIEKVNIQDTDFEKNADFYHTHFKNGFYQEDGQEKLGYIYFKALNFRKLALFGDTVFDKEFYLKYVTLEGYSHFRNAEFKKGLNLDYSNIQNEMNFFGSEGLETAISKKYTSQETYRIVKHNFEKLGNKIEANKYHALELQKKKDTLYKKITDWFFIDKKLSFSDFIDSIILTFHWLTSLYSTNWLLALFWIFIISIGTNFSLNNDITFECIFKYINILSNINDFKNSYVAMVLNKVSLGYLYYQFLMSVRKDTRK